MSRPTRRIRATGPRARRLVLALALAAACGPWGPAARVSAAEVRSADPPVPAATVPDAGAPGAAAPAFLLDAPDVRPLAAADVAADPPPWRFPPGERAVYAVRYLGVEIGHVTVEVARWITVGGRRVAHVVATGRTNELFSVLYPIDDRSEAWIDVDRAVTLRTATWVHHGRRKETIEEVVFDWDAHYVFVLEEKKHVPRVREVAFDFGPHVYDTFDVVYAIRALALAPGFETELPVYASRKVYGLELRVAARGPVRAPALGGEVPALVLRPRNRVDGELQPDGRGRITVTDDARHLPVRVDGWLRTNEGIRVPGIAAELVAFEPGDPAWRALGPTRLAARPGAATVDGRPRWTPPAPLVATRERRGLLPVDRKFHGATSVPPCEGVWHGAPAPLLAAFAAGVQGADCRREAARPAGPPEDAPASAGTGFGGGH